MKTVKKMIKYSFFGIFSYFYILGVTFVLTDNAGIYYILSYVIAMLSSTFINFFFATDIIFKTKNRSLNTFLKYLLTLGIFYILNTMGVYILTEILNQNYKIPVILLTLFSSLIKFFIYNKFVFLERGAKQRLEREIELHKKLALNYENQREKVITSRFYSLHWFSIMINMVPNDTNVRRILDVGCGTGLSYKILHEKFPDAAYTGADISEDMISIGKKRYKEIELKVMDAQKLDFPENTFDLIIARSILHHISYPEKSVNEMRRVLKKDGIIIISEPNKTILSRIVRFFLNRLSGHFDEDHTHYTKYEMKAILEKAGLKIKKIRYFGYLAYPFGFPDIINILKNIKISILKYLTRVDEKLSTSCLKTQGFHLIISSTKN